MTEQCPSARRITSAEQTLSLLVDDWGSNIREMNAQAYELRAKRLWRSGERTLLRELGLHNNEVLMCSALSWLLTPDGSHGLGSRLLTELLTWLDLPSEGVDHATISKEEHRRETRADIVIRTQAATVLIEAKINAPEGSRQADRIFEDWEDEEPYFVFLTPSGRPPTTATISKGSWIQLRWDEIATCGLAIVNEYPVETVAPGAVDFFQSIAKKEVSHMSGSAKLHFYLQHRASIHEWSKLHAMATSRFRETVDQALESTFTGEGPYLWSTASNKARQLRQLKPTGNGAEGGGYLELQWHPSSLFEPSHHQAWPSIVICSNPESGDDCRMAVQEATRPLVEGYMRAHTRQWWIWELDLEPDYQVDDVDAYANWCVERFSTVWRDVGSAIAAANRNSGQT